MGATLRHIDTPHCCHTRNSTYSCYDIALRYAAILIRRCHMADEGAIRHALRARLCATLLADEASIDGDEILPCYAACLPLPFIDIAIRHTRHTERCRALYLRAQRAPREGRRWRAMVRAVYDTHYIAIVASLRIRRSGYAAYAEMSLRQLRR